MLLIAVDGQDTISRTYLFRIDLATHESDEEMRSLLGKPVTLTFSQHSELPGRPVHGLVRRISGCTVGPNDFRLWRAEVVPQLWFLSCVADCRIFQNQSVLDILQVIFKEHGLTDYEIRAQRGNYPKLDYCVQYRESALDFVSRLMERAGVFFWHEHQSEKHLLVIADNNISAKDTGVSVEISQHAGIGNINALENDYSFLPGKWTLTDYNFETPRTRMEASSPTVIDLPLMRQHEIYDYPGEYSTREAGKDVAKLRIEADEAMYHRMQGSGFTAEFDAGRRIEVRNASKDHARCLLVEVHHRAEDRSQITSTAKPPHYDNDFVAIPAKVPFRPQRVTPRPFVRGPQTAVVTGPSGEEIYTDKYGRVKVLFHWDRLSKHDDTSSCWLRVSQAWADRKWGSIHTPRIGQEVIVDFLEGDPDRPIITGRVYNAQNEVPYGLPANATQSGIKSQTVQGSGSNELRFDDKQGSEEVWLHAQKDLNAKVENDETRKVGHDRTTTIHNNETTTIDADKDTTVKGKFKETVAGTETRSVTGDVSETFGANETAMVTGNVKQTIGGTFTQTVTGGINISTPGAVTITAQGGCRAVQRSIQLSG